MKCYDKQISKSQIYEIRPATIRCLFVCLFFLLSHTHAHTHTHTHTHTYIHARTHTAPNRFPMFVYGAPEQWRNVLVSRSGFWLGPRCHPMMKVEVCFKPENLNSDEKAIGCSECECICLYVLGLWFPGRLINCMLGLLQWGCSICCNYRKERTISISGPPRGLGSKCSCPPWSLMVIYCHGTISCSPGTPSDAAMCRLARHRRLL